MNATVKDVMTTQVVVVRSGATFKEMAAALRQYRVSAFPVIDEHEKVIGIVSEADLLAKEALTNPGVLTGVLHHEDVSKAEGLTAGDLMTPRAVTVRPEDSVEHAAQLMYFLKVKRMPVVDADGGLVGLVSRADVLAVYDRPDDDIREEITGNVIVRGFGKDPRQFAVTVQAGVVTVQGSPETAALGHDIVRKIRHVPGVVAVHDQLGYPDIYPIVAGPVF
ncbi:MAG TPA: CBS domain-containing protein [Streptosporangiaceae bacterium]|nr:CBS domain-containing protein [Streptosporangiaceae bacterium]